MQKGKDNYSSRSLPGGGGGVHREGRCRTVVVERIGDALLHQPYPAKPAFTFEYVHDVIERDAVDPCVGIGFMTERPEALIDLHKDILCKVPRQLLIPGASEGKPEDPSSVVAV